MKRLTAMLLALCCLFALTACGAQGDPGPMDEELQSDAPDASPSASPSAEPEADNTPNPPQKPRRVKVRF